MRHLTRPDDMPNITQVDNLEVLRENVAEVIWVPTHMDVVNSMLYMAELTRHDVLYDLGCGDGRIIVEAARQYGCRAIGFEVQPIKIQNALDRIKQFHVEHLVSIKQADIFKVDLSGATVVTTYLEKRLNAELKPQLELMWKVNPRARVVTHQYRIMGYKASNVEKNLAIRNDPQFHMYPQGSSYLYLNIFGKTHHNDDSVSENKLKVY
jgi:precorrin-6B methylase 2